MDRQQTEVQTVTLMNRESSGATDMENLDRLLRIFNGGTGVNLGNTLVKVIEAQAIYDNTRETRYELELVDIIFASICGWRVRRRLDMKIKLEEGKRRVTINDTRKSLPIVLPHMTQRVKTFYMDPLESFKRRDTIIIPNVPTKSARAQSMIGGTPITRETAIELRNITLGSTVHSFSSEFRKSALVFQDLSSKYAFGLHTKRCGSRAFVLCFQAYLLKHLQFGKEFSSSLGTKNALHPNDFERRKALCSAICEILWQAGNCTRCCLCLMQETAYFDTDYQYRVDGITEKLNLYEFKKFEDVELFVKRHLSHFEHENSNGCILLLYSVILSRTINKIYEDMGLSAVERFKLLTDNEECTTPLLHLILTGHAVPCYHNGSIIYDKDGHLLPKPLRGLKERSNIGFLFWNKMEDDDDRTEIGSMLKTPKTPIWLTLINGQYGLLFSNNLDLVSDWRVEHHFTLYYYTGLIQNTLATLTVESLRTQKLEPDIPLDQVIGSKCKWKCTEIGDWCAAMAVSHHRIAYTRFTRKPRCKTALLRKVEDAKIPPLEQCILTKWFGATVDWNGIYPFI